MQLRKAEPGGDSSNVDKTLSGPEARLSQRESDVAAPATDEQREVSRRAGTAETSTATHAKPTRTQKQLKKKRLKRIKVIQHFMEKRNLAVIQAMQLWNTNTKRHWRRLNKRKRVP